MRGVRRFILLFACAGFGAASAAQNRAELPPGAVVQPLDSGPGAELRRNLSTLADNPRSLAALLGAGQAALAMGDAEAAYSFFERANEVDAASPRAKAGMATSLLRLERAQEALPLFAEAERLGAPEAEIAGDRGLAHDLVGEQARAQADYHLALRNEDDPEIRRRLALSLAISGRREEALRTIDAQLRAQDRAGWRTQAFVLALTGDSRGAERTARGAMPPAAAEEMAPFLRRLAELTPSQKAQAVHLGHFPSQGQPASVALAEAQPLPQPPPEPIRRQIAQAAPDPRAVAQVQPEPEPEPEESSPAASEPPPQPLEEPAVETAEPVSLPPSDTAAQPMSTDAATAGFTLAPGGVQPAPAATATAEPSPSSQPPPPAPARSRLEGIAELVEALPPDAQPAPARAESRPSTRSPATALRPAAAARQSPVRYWVQLAHAARPGPLAGEFAEVRAKASALLGSRTPYVTVANRQSLLLVGPFDTRNAASAFVRRLAASDVTALAWTSPAGQEIERLRLPNDSASSSRPSRSERSEPQRPAARPARGRSQPEQRPASRRSRTGN